MLLVPGIQLGGADCRNISSGRLRKRSNEREVSRHVAGKIFAVAMESSREWPSGIRIARMKPL
jgi:hypothetical protein